MTQKEIVKDALKTKVVATIQEIHNITNLPQPTIRRILGQGAKSGELDRLAKGVYTLRTKEGQTASIIKSAEAKDEIKKLVQEKAKFDMIFLDPPYIIPGAKGGNRNLTKYDLMSADQFSAFMEDVVKLTRSHNTPIFFMFSASKSNIKALDKYYKAFTNVGLKECHNSVRFQKLYKNGKPYRFGKHQLQEHIFCFSQSGKQRTDIDFNLKPMYQFKTDTKYQTAKPTKLLMELVKASTKPFEIVLDMFSGGGSTAKACARTNRSVLAYEINEEQTEVIMSEVAEIQQQMIVEDEVVEPINFGEQLTLFQLV